MTSDFIFHLGPLRILRCERVWSIQLFRLRVYGFGLRWRYVGVCVVDRD